MDAYKAVELAKNGDEQGFSYVYETTRKIALSVIRRYCDQSREYEDILQDTYIRVYRSLGTLQDAGKLQAWVNKIAANTAIRHNMQKRPLLFSELENDEGEMPEMEDDNEGARPEIAADRRAVSEIVNQVLAILPEDQRTALLMVYGQKVTIREMAEELGISENTIKSRLFQGRKKMLEHRAEFRKLGLEITAGMVAALVSVAFEDSVYAAAGAAGVAAGAATLATSAAEAAEAVGTTSVSGTASAAGAAGTSTVSASAVSTGAVTAESVAATAETATASGAAVSAGAVSSVGASSAATGAAASSAAAGAASSVGAASAAAGGIGIVKIGIAAAAAVVVIGGGAAVVGKTITSQDKAAETVEETYEVDGGMLVNETEPANEAAVTNYNEEEIQSAWESMTGDDIKTLENIGAAIYYYKNLGSDIDAIISTSIDIGLTDDEKAELADFYLFLLNFDNHDFFELIRWSEDYEYIGTSVLDKFTEDWFGMPFSEIYEYCSEDVKISGSEYVFPAVDLTDLAIVYPYYVYDRYDRIRDGAIETYGQCGMESDGGEEFINAPYETYTDEYGFETLRETGGPEERLILKYHPEDFEYSKLRIISVDFWQDGKQVDALNGSGTSGDVTDTADDNHYEPQVTVNMDEDIAFIRQIYAYTNENQGRYTKYHGYSGIIDHTSYADGSDWDGDAWYDGDTCVKVSGKSSDGLYNVSVWYLNPELGGSSDYDYPEYRMVFAFITDNYGNEYRLYFKNGCIIRWIGPDHVEHDFSEGEWFAHFMGQTMDYYSAELAAEWPELCDKLSTVLWTTCPGWYISFEYGEDATEETYAEDATFNAVNTMALPQDAIYDNDTNRSAVAAYKAALLQDSDLQSTSTSGEKTVFGLFDANADGVYEMYVYVPGSASYDTSAYFCWYANGSVYKNVMENGGFYYNSSQCEFMAWYIQDATSVQYFGFDGSSVTEKLNEFYYDPEISLSYELYIADDAAMVAENQAAIDRWNAFVSAGKTVNTVEVTDSALETYLSGTGAEAGTL